MNSIGPKSTCYREGTALVLVLIVVTSMTILSAGFGFRTRIELRLARANAQRTQAYYLALGGIERIKALLSQEELTPATIAAICRFIGTAKEEGLFERIMDFDPADGRLLTYSLRDEQGYLNINESDPTSWMNLACISEECRSSILDWTDEDEDTSAEGAETAFYELLDPPYVSKNRPCVALKELLFLRGVTHLMYLGEDLNRNSILDENERDGQLQVSPDSGGNEPDHGLVDIFSVYGDGTVNINTTSEAILAALPGLGEQAAKLILTYRAGPDRQLGTDDDMCFTSPEDLANVKGLTELQIELLKQYCCFDSGYFRIFSSAGLNDTFKCCLMATVKCTENQVRILCLERLL